jgi:ribosomal protein L19E
MELQGRVRERQREEKGKKGKGQGKTKGKAGEKAARFGFNEVLYYNVSYF